MHPPGGSGKFTIQATTNRTARPQQRIREHATHPQHAPHLPHLSGIHRRPLSRALRVEQADGGGQVAAARQRRHCGRGSRVEGGWSRAGG